MKKQYPLKYALLTLGVAVLLVAALTGAFAGGLVLAPRMGLEAQAAPHTQDDLAAAYEQTLINVYENNLPSVVSIQVTKKIQRGEGQQLPFPFPLPQEPPEGQQNPPGGPPEEFYDRGQGSGFVWDSEGHIVTNYHVVANATEVEVVFADGSVVEAEVLGVDPNSDLAVLQVDVPTGQLQPVTVGDSDQLQVGQIAIAIGNPFGQESTMTSGIISAVGRTIRSGATPFSIPEVIQTDASINPGNSGGPLLTRQGEVIGINTQIISRSGASAGIGFAVPINIARQVVPTLIEGQTYEYAWLGITGQTLSPEVADFMKLPVDTRGALVVNVTQDSPADEAGLQGSDKVLQVAGAEYQLGGDVIIAIEGEPIQGMDDLIAYLIENTKPGDEVTLDLIRPSGEEEQVSVTLGTRPTMEELTEQQ